MGRHFYSNDPYSDAPYKLKLQQDLVASNTHAKQTRISTSTEATWYPLDTAIITWRDNNNVQASRKPFQRTKLYYGGEITCQGTIEFNRHPVLFHALSKGVEILIEKNGDKRYEVFDVGSKYTASDNVNIQLFERNVTVDDVIAGAWDPTAGGYLYLPMTGPVFSMQCIVKPFSADEIIYRFHEIVFGEISTNFRGNNTIEFHAGWVNVGGAVTTTDSKS